MSSAFELQLLRWSRVHASVMLLASGASLWLGHPGPVALLALPSLFGLILLGRGRFTPSGGFGAANGLTALRLLLVLLLGFSHRLLLGWAGSLLLLVVFTLDGLDGWLARRGGQASAFGAHFDMEVDALMVLVASLALVQGQRVGAFLLIAGWLRYLFVISTALRPARGPEPARRSGRYIFSAMTVSLCASYADLPGQRPLAAVATSLLVISFGRSFLWHFRGR